MSKQVKLSSLNILQVIVPNCQQKKEWTLLWKACEKQLPLHITYTTALLHIMYFSSIALENFNSFIFHTANSKRGSHSAMYSLWIDYLLQKKKIISTKPKTLFNSCKAEHEALRSPQPSVTAHRISLSSDQCHNILWRVLLAVLKVACIHACSVQYRQHAMLLRVALL